MKPSTITVNLLNHKDIAVSVNDGLALHEKLLELIRENEEQIIIDFTGVGVLTHQYINASIGLLLKDYDIKYLQSRLSFEGMDQYQKWLLNYVIENAINYYDKKAA